VSIRFDVYQGIAPQWPELAVGGPLLASPGWLRSMSGRLGDQMITFLVSEHGTARLAALASVQSAPQPQEFFDLHHVLITASRGLPLTARARAARAELSAEAPGPEHWTPSLVVMLPGYECVPVGPGKDDATLLGALVDGACRWAWQRDLRAVAFLYTRPEATSLASTLTGRDFEEVPLSLTWELRVPADGMAGYLRALSAKRRGEVLREMRRIDDAGVQLRVIEAGVELAPSVLDTLATLRCQLVRKYRGTADEDIERYRLSMAVTDVAPGRACVILAQAGDTPVGFTLFGSHGTAWHGLGAGYDYTDPRSRLTYFATLFYAAVPAAAAAGARTLCYGQTSAKAKLSRGCVGIPLTGWLASRDPALRAAAAASGRVSELEPD
jgi:hypothetical protein